MATKKHFYVYTWLLLSMLDCTETVSFSKHIYPYDYSPVLLLTILGPSRSIVCGVSAKRALEMLTV